MAGPRDKVRFDGINPEPVTFKIDNSTIVYSSTANGGSTAVNKLVKISGPSTVALVADGDPIDGKLLLVHSDGFCSVQTDGYDYGVGGNGATLTSGAKAVGALDAGSNPGFCRAAASDAERAKTSAKIIDGSSAAEVALKFG